MINEHLKDGKVQLTCGLLKVSLIQSGAELVHHHQDLGEERLQAGLDTGGALGQSVQRLGRLVDGDVGPAMPAQKLDRLPLSLVDQLGQATSRWWKRKTATEGYCLQNLWKTTVRGAKRQSFDACN